MFSVLLYFFFFFFSSRRRHTRSLCDWSSERVLFRSLLLLVEREQARGQVQPPLLFIGIVREVEDAVILAEPVAVEILRSEERRVGKECRSRWWRNEEKRNRV